MSATEVMDLIDSPTVRTSREMFVESVLVAILESIDSREDRRQFLKEIWVCAQQHLTDRLDLSWSPRGMWHRIVKKVAMQPDTLDPRASELSVQRVDGGERTT